MKESRIYTLDSSDIKRMLKVSTNIELNNVFEGFRKSFFGIQNPTENLEKYNLVYVSHHRVLSGLLLDSGRFIDERDFQTLEFARAIELRFIEPNCLAVFNTFQSKLKQLYEAKGIVCMPDEVAYRGGHYLVTGMENKHSLDYLKQVDILELYRSYFLEGEFVENRKNQQKVYLMYDQIEGMVKVGETKDLIKNRVKGVSEPTKRAKDPMIECLVAWTVSKEFEDQLHEEFKSKRVRGEWFDLRTTDLEKISNITINYPRIRL